MTRGNTLLIQTTCNYMKRDVYFYLRKSWPTHSPYMKIKGCSNNHNNKSIVLRTKFEIFNNRITFDLYFNEIVKNKGYLLYFKIIINTYAYCYIICLMYKYNIINSY